jgi:hypothetical protein
MRIGSVAAAPFVGGEFVSLYLGAERVPTVPGKPTQVAGEWNGFVTLPNFTNPENDGGSTITSYRFYFDGVELTGDNPDEYEFDANLTGQSLRVSAVNAVGEGPLSDPVVVVDNS